MNTTSPHPAAAVTDDKLREEEPDSTRQGRWGRTASSISGSGWQATAPMPSADEDGAETSFARHSRYTLIKLLGRGGSSEIWQAYDQILDRHVAMKIPHTSELSKRQSRLFQREARICARLAHQAIVPIHDCGVLRDGRPFITMPVIEGMTFAELIQKEHAAMGDSLDTDRLRRLVEHARTACEAISYAHDHHVIHRDLKPSNIMLSRYGEVMVVDWGLAVYISEPSKSRPRAQSHTPVEGTYAYMAPEQALGQRHIQDRHTDIFALGGILYEALTGDPPWGRDRKEALRRARARVLIEVPARDGLPHELARICEQALHPEPARRHDSARALADDLTAWLSGIVGMRRARELVSDSDAAAASAGELRASAELHRARAEERLEGVAPNAPEEDKLEAWQAQAEAEADLHSAQLKEVERVQLLHNALELYNLPLAHDRLAEIYRQRHAEAEQQADPLAVQQLAYLLRAHDRGQHSDYLKGTGTLTLLTGQPADIEILRYAPHRRRLRLRPHLPPRPAPIVALELPIGSYMALIRSPGRATVRYPFEIRRLQRSGSLSPDGEPRPIWLPRPEQIPPSACYVPAAPFWSGGDTEVLGARLPLRRVRMGGFFIDRLQTTNGDYLRFLNALVEAGDEAAALEHCPRGRDQIFYGRDPDGRFCLTRDADGDQWLARWPVVAVVPSSINAYAAWRGAQDGIDWRLPHELEWEQAARGADRRLHVWGGDQIDPTWCRIAASTSHMRGQPACVDEYPLDESPYGVRGMSGNVADICADHYRREGPEITDGRWRAHPEPTGLRPLRGGVWNGHPLRSRIAFRGGIPDQGRSMTAGFRLVAPLPRE